MEHKIICLYCGQEKVYDRDRGQKFCGKECASRYNRNLKPAIVAKSVTYRNFTYGDYDRSLNWTKKNGRWNCPYNKEVHCTARFCTKCGWNPDVAKERLDKIMGVTDGD